MRTAIHARMWSEHQERERTIGSQLEALRSYVAENQLQVVEAFSDEGGTDLVGHSRSLAHTLVRRAPIVSRPASTISQSKARHWHQRFLLFLRPLDGSVPATLDGKHPKVKRGWPNV